jgi:hypothetical protein
MSEGEKVKKSLLLRWKSLFLCQSSYNLANEECSFVCISSRSTLNGKLFEMLKTH